MSFKPKTNSLRRSFHHANKENMNPFKRNSKTQKAKIQEDLTPEKQTVQKKRSIVCLNDCKQSCMINYGFASLKFSVVSKVKSTKEVKTTIFKLF